MLKDDYKHIAGKYISDNTFIENLWIEIAAAHSAAGRHYHTIIHLENLHTQLLAVQQDIEDWESIIFAIAYHDFVYSIHSVSNEEDSAVIAVERLQQINYPDDKAARCQAHILATKSHKTTDDNDTNLFTDADLSILGAAWEKYKSYAIQIGKEYAEMPMFKTGRKEFLQQFLKKPSLFKTEYFYNKYESQARKNIQREIDELLN